MYFCIYFMNQENISSCAVKSRNHALVLFMISMFPVVRVKMNKREVLSFHDDTRLFILIYKEKKVTRCKVNY